MQKAENLWEEGGVIRLKPKRNLNSFFISIPTDILMSAAAAVQVQSIQLVFENFDKLANCGEQVRETEFGTLAKKRVEPIKIEQI